MTTQDDAISEMRTRLLQEQAVVQEEIDSLRSRLEARGSYSLGEGDPMIYQWEFNLAMLKRAEQHMAEIDEALAQIDKGHYGLCEVCGNPIDPERLAVLPYTKTCSTCADQASQNRQRPRHDDAGPSKPRGGGQRRR